MIGTPIPKLTESEVLELWEVLNADTEPFHYSDISEPVLDILHRVEVQNHVPDGHSDQNMYFQGYSRARYAAEWFEAPNPAGGWLWSELESLLRSRGVL